MKFTRTHMIAAGIAGIALLAIIAFFAFRQGDVPQGQDQTDTARTERTTPARDKVPQAQVTTQQLTQVGLYTIDYKQFVTESLADRYSFIAELMKPEESPDTPGHMLPAQLPANINVAEINIPSKQLTLLAIYTNGSSFCVGKYCMFNLYVKRPEGFQNYIGLPSTQQSYIMVDDKSVSVIVCSEYEPYYQQWRLEDGALEKPIPPNSPGHFVPVGAFKHDKIAACP